MHQNTPTEIVTGDSTDLTVVLAHGRGHSPEWMADLVGRIDMRDIRFLCLEADNNTWYPDSFMAEFDDNEPWLSAALEHYEDVVSGLIDEGVAPTSIVLGGFSQGACLTAEYVARHPRPYGGVMVLTGGLIGPEGTSWEPADELASTSVYQTTAADDPWIPVRRAKETAAWFERSGADLNFELFESREHHVSDEEVATIRRLLEDVWLSSVREDA